jgi:RNA polymerase sigma factor (sigma-70 family)
VAIQLDRDEQVAAFYRQHAARLRRAIRAKAFGVGDDIIEDACAVAWERLLGRPDIDLQRYEAYWWLYKVALREAWALGRRRNREQPIGGLNGADDDAPEPVDLDSDVAEIVAERIEHASMRDVLGGLHWRERRELALFAYGLSYEEIAAVTGTSYTAVNRWMARGRNALRAARACGELPVDDHERPAR